MSFRARFPAVPTGESRQRLLFKQALKGISLSFVLAFVCACSKPPESRGNVVFNVGDTSCTSGLAQRIQDFFKGATATDEMHGVWTCANQIVTDFTNVTFGSSPGVYTSADLQHFLSTYYLKSGVSNDVMTSTLRLKQLLVGGSADALTKDEIGKLMDVINQLDGITHQLAPYAPVIFGSSSSHVTDPQWAVAYQNFGIALNSLSGVLSRTGQAYALADFTNLLTAWCTQLKVAPNSPFQKIILALPALGTGKSVLIGGDANGIAAGELQPLLGAIASVYADYRQIQRLSDSHPGDWTGVLTEAGLATVVGNVASLLSGAVNAQSDKAIQFTTIQTLLVQLQTAGFLPASLTPDQAMAAVQFAVTKLFNAPNASATSIDTLHVGQLQQLLSTWQTYEAALESGDYGGSATGFSQAMHPGWTLSLDTSGRLLIPGGNSAVTLNREFSLLYVVVEWLGNQWSTWPMNSNSFLGLVSDTFGLLQTLNLVSQSDTAKSWSTKIFEHSDLFMPSGNGDNLLQLTEGFQFGVVALSAYRGLHAIEAGSGCDSTDDACLQSYLYAQRSNLIENLPSLLAWIGTQPADWSGLATDLVNTAGTGEMLEEMIELHVIEIFMQRFDLNHDGLINLAEAEAAFPVFQPFLTRELSILFPPDQIEVLFTFLFKYGNTPDAVQFGSVRYLYWDWHPSTWQFSADRKTLADILAALARLEKLLG